MSSSVVLTLHRTVALESKELTSRNDTMLTREINTDDLKAVFPVPPLARNRDEERTIHAEENLKIVRHIEGGGLRRLLYGGNAVFYHISLKEFEATLRLLAEIAADDTWVIPSVGPSFGTAIDQLEILKDFPYPSAMFLPVSPPQNHEGVYAGISEFVQRWGKPVIVYVKAESNLGVEQIARLFDEGTALALKYAVVRDDPSEDAFLDAILDRVDKSRVISGIGERPAIVHMNKFQLPGYTTGSGCLAPAATQKMFELLCRGDTEGASAIRDHFLALEDERDGMGPINVLHEAFRLAGVADTGPLPPMLATIAESVWPCVKQAAAGLMAFERSLSGERGNA
ncbi:MAG: dihydrodipicolinate synthase family protein [Planctomycetota bacterium]|nr:dihydrodipicolinate synthase family protein [Planctomycetota bacterium]MDA1137215.1 dihydrodipicolinate synthase family protein [Planctomycetota bacterium]